MLQTHAPLLAGCSVCNAALAPGPFSAATLAHWRVRVLLRMSHARARAQVLNMIGDPEVEHAVRGAGAPLAAVDDLRRCLPPPYKELGLEKRLVRSRPGLRSSACSSSLCDWSLPCRAGGRVYVAGPAVHRLRRLAARNVSGRA